MTLIVSLLITYQAVNIAKIEVKQKTQVYFDYRVRDATNLINQRMQAYRQVLLGAAGLFKTSNNVERHEFKQYVETLDLAKNYPGIQGVGFSLIVPSSKKTQHIASIRSEGFPEYTIRPDSQREIYTSIVYLEPFSGRNLRAFGYDMFSETVRHAAMQKAIDSGQTTLSGKVKLVQETGKQEQAGFLMYMPIYSNGTNNDTPSARREHIIGWVYAPFRMNDLMDGLFGEYASDLGIRIFDGESMSGGALMYDSDGSSHPNAEISKTVHLQIVDHPWTMHIRPLPIMSSRVETNHPKLVAIIGTIISVLLTLLIWFLATGRDRAIHAAKSMNNELITERQRLSSIIEGTHVGTWEWNVQTGATNFNEYWANIIGYELSELEPISIETWMKFVHPDDAKVSGELLEKHFSGELAYYECEARMRHKDGRWIWVLDRGKVTAWTPDGKPLLMAGTHQEINERKQAEITLNEHEAHFRSILENSPIAIRITSVETGKVRFANQDYAKLINLTLDAVLGFDPKQYYANPQDYVEVINSLNRGERVTNKLIEIINFTQPAKSKWTLASYMLITFDNELAVLGWFFDVTDSKQAHEERERLLAIIEESPDFIATFDMKARIKYLNKAGGKLVRLPADVDLAPLEIRDMHPDWASKLVLEKGIPTALQQGFWHGETALLDREGHEKPVAELLMVHRDKFGKPEMLSTIMRDISSIKHTENELRIAAIAFESQEGMIVTDANNNILRVNLAFTAITGYTSEEAVGQTPRLLSSGRQDKAFYEAMWERLNQTGAWEGEIWNRRKSGEVYPEHLTITAVKEASGTVTNYVATLTDITMSKAASDEIKNLAFYDPLTRLPNRRLLLDRLQQALAASTRSEQRGALLFLDLDHFKTLNDTLGHDAGDLLLQQVANRLSNCVREGDTVARLGGDEFVVLLEDLSEQPIEAAAQTVVIAQKILASLNQPYQLGMHEHHSTPSIGATLFNDHEAGLEAILKQADIAMYQSKTEGRNTLRFYDPKMQEAITTRVDMERELRQAIEQQQFQLYYQIQVDNSGKPLGAEALIRWIHPERNMIPPLQFIPLAEETGLILQIGQWVLETACAQLKIWHQNPHRRDLVLSVNVSAKQIHQDDFVTQVQETIQRHGIDAQKLKLELTESMLVANLDDIIEKMNALSQIGVRFSLDDFGTGYSSLQYLKKLPLCQLKIDQSFVRDIVTDDSHHAIVRTIIAMAHSLNLGVIAEGVETEGQRQCLLGKDCTNFQGYLFGKPVPIHEFEVALGKD
ncbi:MAG: EAL domain-containing protein [Methylotenera sp.]|nr:EAL domain-containing protein [Methylotenera sp.]MDP2404210.1 EAL domain-containing protein [Methylotenera sp.]MDP3095528.1 EAL domain-containing protein [Methylotenera sp.]MDZ4222571.1 EAL domain-containing protein [Methylotenera sp.]